MRLAFRCTKSVKKLEGKYYTNNLCIIDAVQICITFHPQLHTEVEILGLGCERKHDLINQSKVNEAHEFVFFYVQTKYEF